LEGQVAAQVPDRLEESEAVVLHSLPPMLYLLGPSLSAESKIAQHVSDVNQRH
jgi:hypothetical protein